MCEVDEEFEGVNHKTSHDGIFKVVAHDIGQKYLDMVDKIRITVGGSYISRAKDTNLIEQ